MKSRCTFHTMSQKLALSHFSHVEEVEKKVFHDVIKINELGVLRFPFTTKKKRIFSQKQNERPTFSGRFHTKPSLMWKNAFVLH